MQEYPVGEWPADEESSGGEKDYPDTPDTPPTSGHSSYNVFQFEADMDLQCGAVFAAQDGEEVTTRAHMYYSTVQVGSQSVSNLSTQSFDRGSSTGGLMDTSSVSLMSQESGVDKLGLSPPGQPEEEKSKKDDD